MNRLTKDSAIERRLLDLAYTIANMLSAARSARRIHGAVGHAPERLLFAPPP